MEQGFQHWANPSSPHAVGRKARSLLEDARDRVKAALGWQGEVIFTSGASEAAALALGHAKGLGDGQRVQVDIARRLFDATVTLGPLFDREGARMKP